MGIKKQFLIPECYIQKIPVCDNCGLPLQDTGRRLMSYPPKATFICNHCNKEHTFFENELQGEWKWRTI